MGNQFKRDTLAVHEGRPKKEQRGIVNPAVQRSSTVLFATLDELEASHGEIPHPGQLSYGRQGLATTFALEEAVTALEGGYAALTVSSGLAAITTTLLAFVSRGDHLLVTDSVYGPTRRFCDRMLGRLGVETTYYDPMIGAGIDALIRPGTRCIFLESPGSLTFEVQDVPAIAEAARRRGVATLLDNTWATPLLFRPLEHGIDISIHAVTKYIGGHSDLLLGMIVTSEETYGAVRSARSLVGQHASPDDAWLALRGLRTLAARLPRHEATGLAIAQWLQGRPEVARVIHPALPGCPGHEFWRRDFDGASGLFAFELEPCPRRALAAMLDGMELFGMGYSWGGFESLLIPVWPEQVRTATAWRTDGPLLRLHAGLENADDLIADLEAGLYRLRNSG